MRRAQRRAAHPAQLRAAGRHGGSGAAAHGQALAQAGRLPGVSGPPGLDAERPPREDSTGSQQHAEGVIPAQLGGLVGSEAKPPALLGTAAQPALDGPAAPLEQDPADRDARRGGHGEGEQGGENPDRAEFQRCCHSALRAGPRQARSPAALSCALRYRTSALSSAPGPAASSAASRAACASPRSTSLPSRASRARIDTRSSATDRKPPPIAVSSSPPSAWSSPGRIRTMLPSAMMPSTGV